MNVRLEVVILSQKQHIRFLKKIDFENIDKENNSTKIASPRFFKLGWHRVIILSNLVEIDKCFLLNGWR